MESFYEVTIKTLNHEKIINNLSNKVELFNVEKKDYNILKLQVKYSQKKILNKYLKNNNFEILKHKSFGLLSFILKVFRRLGITFGILFSIILFLILNQFIFKIEITGNDKVSRQEIINFLDENFDLKFKHSVNTKDIELAIQSNFDKVSLTSVITKGSTIVINIKEKLDSDILNTTLTPMIACYDGKITEIKLSQGTLNVKVGQTVKKGDVLVYPYIIDSAGNKKDILPQASIMAKIWVEGSIYYQENEISFVRTGKSKTINYLTIGKFSLNTKPNSPFKKYDTEEKTFYITKNNILPIINHQITYFETEEKLINNNFEEDKEKLILQCKEIALQKINEYDIIKKEKVLISQNAGIVNMKVVLELEKDITYEN